MKKRLRKKLIKKARDSLLYFAAVYLPKNKVYSSMGTKPTSRSVFGKLATYYFIETGIPTDSAPPVGRFKRASPTLEFDYRFGKSRLK